MIGTYALSAGYYDAWYLKAQKVRTLIRREFDAALKKYDAIITPTSPSIAFKIGEKADDPFQMYLSDICTIPVNIAGLPPEVIQALGNKGETRTIEAKLLVGLLEAFFLLFVKQEELLPTTWISGLQSPIQLFQILNSIC